MTSCISLRTATHDCSSSARVASFRRGEIEGDRCREISRGRREVVPAFRVVTDERVDARAERLVVEGGLGLVGRDARHEHRG
jgi:hypothetical protein